MREACSQHLLRKFDRFVESELLQGRTPTNTGFINRLSQPLVHVVPAARTGSDHHFQCVQPSPSGYQSDHLRQIRITMGVIHDQQSVSVRYLVLGTWVPRTHFAGREDIPGRLPNCPLAHQFCLADAAPARQYGDDRLGRTEKTVKGVEMQPSAAKHLVVVEEQARSLFDCTGIACKKRLR